LKAKRIKKSQEKVLGNLDDLKEDDDDEEFKEKIQVKRAPRIKKKIIVYKNDETDDTETDADYVEVVKKQRKKKTVVEPESIPKPPVIHRIVQFV
jgi:hypothetical protein